MTADLTAATTPETQHKMTHHNAPLTIERRRRLVQRCRDRPIAQVAAEMGISRACASKWVNRHPRFGDLGLEDRSSAPQSQPTTTLAHVVAQIEAMRRQCKWSATRITFDLHAQGEVISRRTVSRHLAALGLNRRRFIDPNGQTNRQSQPIIARRPGHMVHVDVTKVGRIPDGGGWRVHGKGSAQAKAVGRSTAAGTRAGCLPTLGGRRILPAAYTEALDDEKAATAIGFIHRARVFFAAHGIDRIERIVTDNGACYRAKDFARVLRGARHQRITPYTPRHNGKVERYHRILAEESLYARTWTSEEQRSEALNVWNIHFNYHRPHSGANGQPPASRLAAGVTNVLASYTARDPGFVGCQAAWVSGLV
jgi:transposase InsO family protein